MPTTDMIRYYAKRAGEYERIYSKPERQTDLAQLKELIRQNFMDRSVLEIACGTGYWTEVLGGCARSVLATDINDEVLEIARHKEGIPRGEHITLQRGEAYDPPRGGSFSGCLAAFWWSHMPKDRIAEFLFQLHECLEIGAKVMFMDNRYVPGSSTPIHRTDDRGNTYQLRKLDSGEEYEVLKNFPNETELEAALAKCDRHATIELFPYYWVLSYDNCVRA